MYILRFLHAGMTPYETFFPIEQTMVPYLQPIGLEMVA